ncbi:MAG: hypothetical protein L6300_09150, partial [Syntrophaceae bacterium]|nr:hypothetical protein [Syntrophaceae bacterium]
MTDKSREIIFTQTYPFRQKGDKYGPEYRTVHRTQTADQDHHQKADGFQNGKILRTDKTHEMCKKGSGYPGIKGAYTKSGRLIHRQI